MTPERAARIVQGLAMSMAENLGRIIMPVSVVEELRLAGLIDPKGEIRLEALMELAETKRDSEGS